MSKTKVTSNIKQVTRDLNRVNKAYKQLMQRSIAETINEIRLDAHDNQIIDNNTGITNPYRARKRQPTTPGKLTSRTGKLKYMLRDRVDRIVPTKGWKGFGKKLVKHKSAGLHGLIRRVERGNFKEEYRGTLRVWIRANARLYYTGTGKRGAVNKMPRETPRSLALRFMWDWAPGGLKGQGRRPFISPAAENNSRDFRRTAEIRWNKLVAIENRKAGLK